MYEGHGVVSEVLLSVNASTFVSVGGRRIRSSKVGYTGAIVRRPLATRASYEYARHARAHTKAPAHGRSTCTWIFVVVTNFKSSSAARMPSDKGRSPNFFPEKKPVFMSVSSFPLSLNTRVAVFSFLIGSDASPLSLLRFRALPFA